LSAPLLLCHLKNNNHLIFKFKFNLNTISVHLLVIKMGRYFHVSRIKRCWLVCKSKLKMNIFYYNIHVYGSSELREQYESKMQNLYKIINVIINDFSSNKNKINSNINSTSTVAFNSLSLLQITVSKPEKI
jgi:hypothetical protein